MAKLKIDDKEIPVKDGESIVEECEELGVPFSCHAGSCGICKIEIVEGAENLSELTDAEIEMGMDKKNRLACQCKIKKGEVKIKF